MSCRKVLITAHRSSVPPGSAGAWRAATSIPATRSRPASRPMRALGRLIVVIAAAFGGLVASQFPEFAQQYRQRLGGAVDELLRVVADFDADASRNQLTREAALQTYGRSGEPFLQDRGT